MSDSEIYRTYGGAANWAIHASEFFRHAQADAIYDLYRSRKQADPEAEIVWRSTGDLYVSEENERILVQRDDPLISLALAQWSSNNETVAETYMRHCSYEPRDAWPPPAGSAAYAILSALLANQFNPLPTLLRGAFPNYERIFSDEALDRLIERSDEDGLFTVLHQNPRLAEKLLRSWAKREGAYSRISEDRWLLAFKVLMSNPFVTRQIRDGFEGPDVSHWGTHRDIVTAIKNCPKTEAGARTVLEALEELPPKSTAGTYVRDEFVDAVEAWNGVTIEWDKDDKYHVFNRSAEVDNLTPAQRIQFHLLRHYARYFDLDPEDADVIRRLATYATSSFNGGKRWGGTWKGAGLDKKKIDHYAKRDNTAFIFACSFNPHIWTNEDLSDQVRLVAPDVGEYHSNEMALNRRRSIHDFKAIESNRRKNLGIDDEPEQSTPLTLESLKDQFQNLKTWVEQRAERVFKTALAAVFVFAVVYWLTH